MKLNPPICLALWSTLLTTLSLSAQSPSPQAASAPETRQSEASREITLTQKLLHFPVKAGAPKRKVKVLVDGKVERFFDIELADNTPDWWAPLNVSKWIGKTT